mmetsp:Transcript_15483/g.37538  ORF Transcript_15483/g.37538 Transcript_15483/m.37538 type:complete len:249 (+) Transcript_15483:916-1662(+)
MAVRRRVGVRVVSVNVLVQPRRQQLECRGSHAQPGKARPREEASAVARRREERCVGEVAPGRRSDLEELRKKILDVACAEVRGVKDKELGVLGPEGGEDAALEDVEEGLEEDVSVYGRFGRVAHALDEVEREEHHHVQLLRPHNILPLLHALGAVRQLHVKQRVAALLPSVRVPHKVLHNNLHVNLHQVVNHHIQQRSQDLWHVLQDLQRILQKAALHLKVSALVRKAVLELIQQCGRPCRERLYDPR